MNWLDGLIVVVLLAAVVRGVELGLIRQLCSAVAFFGGLFLGALLESKLIHLANTPGSRAMLSLGLILGCGFALLAVGEVVGNVIKSRLEPSRLNKADRALGSVTAACTVLIAVWLGANIFNSAPSQALQRQVHGSWIVSSLNHSLPPAPKVIAQLSHLISPNGFPTVFSGFEPNPNEREVVIPDMGEFTPAVTKSAPSVVKVEGRGCGGIVDGTGFVAANDLVITNAHVVAGVAHPEVIDSRGVHATTVVWFNPDLDFAVLRTRDLAGKPLPLTSQTVTDGTPGAVLGYPGGGVFSAKPAAIIDSFTAKGRNIYNQDTTLRQIYSMQAEIISGNSGGPLINKEGTVIGIVFAHSVNYEHIGYALTMEQAVKELNQAKQRIQAVSTGDCAQ